MNKQILILNLAAQDMLNVSDVIHTYKNSEERIQELYRELVAGCFLQAAPIYKEEVLVRKSRNENGSNSIEHFETLLQTFCLADKRRRQERCQGLCSHEWHNISEELKHSVISEFETTFQL